MQRTIRGSLFNRNYFHGKVHTEKLRGSDGRLYPRIGVAQRIVDTVTPKMLVTARLITRVITRDFVQTRVSQSRCSPVLHRSFYRVRGFRRDANIRARS